MKTLVLVPKITGRVIYTFDLVLNQLLGLDYTLLTDAQSFGDAEGPKLNYGNARVGDEPILKACSLLFERHTRSQEVHSIDFEGVKGLFPVYGPDNIMPFDVFAASFYLVSRYEEYQPNVCDEHGRFKAESTWMYENGLLQKPLVNIWAMKLGQRLQSYYPDLEIKKRTFNFLPTYDIDAAWAFKNKGFFRTIGGFCHNLIDGDMEQIHSRHEVLRGKRKDPFDSFEFMLDLQKEFKLHPIYFVLCGELDTYDKNISLHNDTFCSLIKHLADYADVGVHPSYGSFLDSERLRAEIDGLAEVLHRPVTKSRQHFLRMKLPSSYQKLIELDIQDDYTMGFASQAGFRAGIADSFRFYDLDNDMVTNLIVHPFALMDGTMRDYLNLDLESSFALATQLVDEVKAVGGTFIYLTHNETLGGENRWVGWPEMYRRLVEYSTK